MDPFTSWLASLLLLQLEGHLPNPPPQTTGLPIRSELCHGEDRAMVPGIKIDRTGHRRHCEPSGVSTRERLALGRFPGEVAMSWHRVGTHTPRAEMERRGEADEYISPHLLGP